MGKLGDWNEFGPARRSREPVAAGPPPAEESLIAEHALRAHFHGRRNARRSDLRLRVRLTNLKFSFQAETIDLSRAGARFCIHDPRFLHGCPGGRLDEFTARVAEYFGRGLFVIFGGGILKRRMDVVRTTLGGLGGIAVPQVACAFPVELTPDECTLLGIHGPARAAGLTIHFDGRE